MCRPRGGGGEGGEGGRGRVAPGSGPSRWCAALPGRSSGWSPTHWPVPAGCARAAPRARLPAAARRVRGHDPARAADRRALGRVRWAASRSGRQAASFPSTPDKRLGARARHQPGTPWRPTHNARSSTAARQQDSHHWWTATMECLVSSGAGEARRHHRIPSGGNASLQATRPPGVAAPAMRAAYGRWQGADVSDGGSWSGLMRLVVKLSCVCVPFEQACLATAGIVCSCEGRWRARGRLCGSSARVRQRRRVRWCRTFSATSSGAFSSGPRWSSPSMSSVVECGITAAN
jgi:hypothetical protein